jgi:hypothetical protein
MRFINPASFHKGKKKGKPTYRADDLKYWHYDPSRTVPFVDSKIDNLKAFKKKLSKYRCPKTYGTESTEMETRNHDDVIACATGDGDFKGIFKESKRRYKLAKKLL